MKILVINGSPKGDYSTTVQTVRYIEKKNPDHEFNYLNVGNRIKSFEKDFSEALSSISEAELVIFSYPVYTFIVPAQLHRFIELMKEHGVDLSDKAVTQVTTSKHFYDVTAHRFIEDNVRDMNGKFIKGLSADMDDLLTKEGQKAATDFFSYLMFSVEKGIFEPNHAVFTAPKHVKFRPVSAEADAPEKPGDVVIVADLGENDVRLREMIERFRSVLPRKTRLVNLRELGIKGGCISCFNCAVSGKCVYKDGFDEFLRSSIQTAEAIVIAFSIRDHSMGSLFKTYDDRQFVNGHRTVTMGMPFGYLVSGNYSEEENLRMIVDARAEVGGNFLAGVATDEYDPEGEIGLLSEKLCYAIENGYVPPANFYGVGGMKIFRDLIWLMQGMMRADHKFYKSHDQYDFPQKKRGTMLKMYLVGALIGNPKIKKKMGNKMNEGMIAPYRKVVDEA